MRSITAIVFAASATATFASAVESPTLVQELIAESAKVHSMRCDIRREVDVDGKLQASLSRVWFQRPNRLHVDAVSPTPRRIVVDGTNIYKWVKGQSKGVVLPLNDAPQAERIQVARVPATGQEYLLHVQDAPETELPSAPSFPVRRGYAQPEPLPFTVVAMNNQGRLGTIELYASAAMTNRLLKVVYSGWKEVADDIWLPGIQEITGYRHKDSVVFETLRASGIMINPAIPPNRFDPESWAADVEFVSQQNMAELLQEGE